ncbi:PREDICTED: endoribonuclease Dicer homolog 3b isoform X4 [Nelumbo nucifera]|uniref:Endoribonuclease Dicer homolog 3b isoform X4 n=1 Tax=Nelumbo nucifera TaxID=4432 RepID=A0A1U8Q4Y3_NELNU|nr:PREDICTED: endoribonuclease Dicer homolog 3b isoform X4 [Nelumbo nucifera]
MLDTKMSYNGDDEVKDSAETAKHFEPRSYQIQIFQVALRKNTIAVLETGAGKTMIAVMLIKEIGRAMKTSGNKMLIIFLAPTVHLVNQQFEVIKIHTDFKVEEYYGAKGIDEWSAKCWEKEISEQDVMVMTPQILLDALRKAFLRIEMVCLVIFDECHRATGNHPYMKIMKEFYHKSRNKPKIFGMTASPVVRKGVSSVMDCEDQISELECVLDSQIYIVEDKTEVEVFVPSAKEINRYYNSTQFSHEDLKTKLKSSRSKFDALLVSIQASLPTQFKDTDDAFNGLKKRLSKYHTKIVCCLDDLGLICAYEAAKDCLENVRVLNTTEDFEFYRASSMQCMSFLEEVLHIIGETLPDENLTFSEMGSHFSEAIKLGYISPKLHELIQIFQSFGGATGVLCLIFVERIITAKVIEKFMKRLGFLSHFTFSYLTGGNASADALTPQMQKKTLDLFRHGKVNLLFSTDVAEEGIHVPNCSCVIRFDLPKTVRSYVQSRGRARQTDSQYILMLERGNIKQRDLLFDVIRSERSMTETATNRDPSACISKVCDVDDINTYTVVATGASITADSSVSLIYRYCEKLPGDKYFTPKPTFQLSLCGESYTCTLVLPPNAAFQTITGPVNRNVHLSKQLVCLEACKKLHQMGALDDHLLPYVEEPPEIGFSEKTNESSGAGTTKRKELHGTTHIRALSGGWGDKMDGVTLQAYKIDFSCNLAWVFYSGFVLLIDANLDDDVANAEVELYLTDKLVKSSISPSGQMHLDADQVRRSKCFQEFFFNGLFGKLFTGSKSSGTQREFLLKKENKSLWNTLNMYLLLPLDSSGIPNDESLRINWRGVDSCVSIVEFLKENSLLSADSCLVSKGNSCSTNSFETEYKVSEVIHLANSNVNLYNLKDMVVLAIHTGRIYSVIKVMIDMSADSCFDSSNAMPPKYATFREYFNKKYGIELMHPQQPLLLLKQSHNPHNLLAKSSQAGGSLCRKTSDAGTALIVDKLQNHVHMPPELLICIDISISVLKSFYLLPSLMHRLEALMLTSQLRDEISYHPSNGCISSSLILEALTTLRCCEKFSLERLELLGDSVLKYAVSCNLFLKYPKEHEGQLSARRSRAVCNSTLHKLGTNKKVQRLEFLGDSVLDLLITCHLYQSHKDVDPGELTDLRSANVNNENFAQVAVRHNLQQHLQHGSGLLLTQITEYVKSASGPSNETMSLRAKVPKVLGDLVESIAGAILMDTKLNTDEVWRIFKPLLSPIITPDRLELPPLRELNETCDSLGYFIKEKCTNKGELVHAELWLQMEDILLIGEGCERSKKAAKGQAASYLLKELKERGISHSRYASKTKKLELESVGGSSVPDLDINHCSQPNGGELVEPISYKKLKTIERLLPVESIADPSLAGDCSHKVSAPELSSSVTISISMQKGGPRSSLYELCKRQHWPMPSLHTIEHKSRLPIEFGDGSEKRKGFNSFVSRISLHIPNSGVIESTGNHSPDKKSSHDSAALSMLHELAKQGKCTIVNL